MCLFSLRPTLYVGKYSTSLYASPSMVHEGVAVVVSLMQGSQMQPSVPFQQRKTLNYKNILLVMNVRQN